MDNKLIVVIMGPGKKHFAEMCLDSVKDADKILYWTSGDENEICKIYDNMKLKKELHAIFLKNDWNNLDPATNGKCRQKYLKHLKENYLNDWCLVLDEDEILEEDGIQKIKKFIKGREPGIYNVKMRHFIGDIGHEDATQGGNIFLPPTNNPTHVVPGRLFKISEAISYPEHSHPVLQGELKGACFTTIWHLGYLPIEYMDYILKRANQNVRDSQIHGVGFIKDWKMAHLFGVYPKIQINPIELPQQILDRYELDRDEFYFANRMQFETKHWEDAINWKDYFGKDKKFILYGCGLGQRVYCLLKIGINAIGFEKSNYACQNSRCKRYFIQGDITKKINFEMSDISICYDVLEHLEYFDLNKTIENIINYTNEKILISVPVLGNPCLEFDSTHIIKEDKEWWIKQFTDKGLKLIPTPKHFLFREQIMIFEK